MDTFVALIAGIAIFPIVFGNSNLVVNAGPSLIFETLPVAFYSLPFGSIFSILFFILLSIAALSSAISLLEPFTAWMEEKTKLKRKIVVSLLGILIWLIGLGSIFSFNIWSDLELKGFNFLSGLDYLTNNIMLPLGGVFIAFLTGWFLPKEFIRESLNMNYILFNIFFFCLRYISVGAIVLIFVYSVL